MNPHVTDLILTFASVGISVGLAVLARPLKERWNIDIDAGRQKTLHSALMTGLAGALGRGLTGQTAINAAVNHVLGAGAPEAVKRFQLSRHDLESMAWAKLAESPGIDLARSLLVGPGGTVPPKPSSAD